VRSFNLSPNALTHRVGQPSWSHIANFLKLMINVSRVILFLSVASVFRASPSIYAVTDTEFAALQKKVAEQQKEIAHLKTEQAKSAAAPSAAVKPTGATTKHASASATAAATSSSADEQLGKKLGEMKVSGSDPIRALDQYFAVPNSPAATALGMNPDTMPRATLPKEFNISNINGVDVRGNPKTGIAVDIAPAQLFNLQWGEHGLTVADYADHPKGMLGWSLEAQEAYWRRVITRTQLSFAGVRGTGSEDKSVRLAAGFNIPLLVSRDVVQTAAANGKVDAAAARSVTGAPTAEDEKPFRQDVWSGRLANTLWEHSDWTLGGFALFTAEKGEGEHFQYGGSTFWSTWSFSYDKPSLWRAVTNVTYHNQELVTAASTGDAESKSDSSVFVREDSLLLGGGLQFGKDDFNATAFGAWLKFWDDDNKDSQAYRYGVVVEKQLTSTLWLTASAGEELGTAHRPNSTFVLGGVKLGLSGNNFANPFGGK
jgi:hypothetical protein